MNKTNALILAVAASGLVACTNPEVPAGHEGYVYHRPLVFGEMEHREVLRGPASTGISWRLYVENIDMRTRSYTEEFQLLTRDNLNVAFEVNTRISLRDGSVKEIVEEWGGTEWYEWNVRQQLRTIVREQVTEFSATAIQLETPVVRAQIENKLQDKYMNADKPTPIIIESVDIGEIQFPPAVAEAIQRKIATKQELERQGFLLAKTEKEAAIKVLESINVAKQQLIISSTLDPLYVQQRAVQVYKQLAESPNRTVIMLPNSPDATGLPLVLTPKTRRVLSDADQQRLRSKLDGLEQKYTEKAQTPAEDLAGDALGAPGEEPGEAPAAASDAPADDAPADEAPAADAPAVGADPLE